MIGSDPTDTFDLDDFNVYIGVNMYYTSFGISIDCDAAI